MAGAGGRGAHCLMLASHDKPASAQLTGEGQTSFHSSPLSHRALVILFICLLFFFLKKYENTQNDEAKFKKYTGIAYNVGYIASPKSCFQNCRFRTVVHELFMHYLSVIFPNFGCED